MAIIYFQGETEQDGIMVKRETAEELVNASNGKLVMTIVE